jgi:hypothetical protein
MFAMKFSGYCPVGPLVLTNVPVQVERTPTGFLAVLEGQCSGDCESIKEAIETVATEVHRVQVNVTICGRPGR